MLARCAPLRIPRRGAFVIPPPRSKASAGLYCPAARQLFFLVLPQTQRLGAEHLRFRSKSRAGWPPIRGRPCSGLRPASALAAAASAATSMAAARRRSGKHLMDRRWCGGFRRSRIAAASLCACRPAGAPVIRAGGPTPLGVLQRRPTEISGLPSPTISRPPIPRIEEPFVAPS